MEGERKMPITTANTRAREVGWNDGTYQLSGGHDALSIVRASSVD
jgi:hypothetical protein